MRLEESALASAGESLVIFHRAHIPALEECHPGFHQTRLSWHSSQYLSAWVWSHLFGNAKNLKVLLSELRLSKLPYWFSRFHIFDRSNLGAMYIASTFVGLSRMGRPACQQHCSRKVKGQQLSWLASRARTHLLWQRKKQVFLML